MKKIILIAAMALLLQSCMAINSVLDLDSGARIDGAELYLHANLAMELVDQLIIWDEYPGAEPSICFMGDSRVQQFPVSRYWPDRHMWNIAMGGSTLYGVEYRLARVRAFQPDIIYISVGINDIRWNRDTDWIVRYGAVIDEMKTFCPRIYVTNIVPVGNNFTNGDALNAKALSMTMQLRDLCEEKDVAYIELDALEDRAGYLDSEYTEDGIHFNKKGYDIIHSILKSYL